jgi:autotransporter adhesin
MLQICLPPRFGRSALTWSPVIACILALSCVGPALAGCNSGNLANTDLLTSSKCQGIGSGVGATAVGPDAFAIGKNSTALGGGSGPASAVAGATAIGYSAGAAGAGVYSTAIGAGALPTEGFSSPQALGNYSIAIGGSDDSNNVGALANGLRSIAIGQKSHTPNDFGTALGFNTTTGFASTAIGTDATASGDSSSAFGRFSKASAASSLALGKGAVASGRDAVAIGSDSLADAPTTVSVGSKTLHRRIVNVARALGGSDAVNLAQVKALILQGAAAPTGVVENRASIDRLKQELAELRAIVQKQSAELDHLRQRSTP